MGGFENSQDCEIGNSVSSTSLPTSPKIERAPDTVTRSNTKTDEVAESLNIETAPAPVLDQKVQRIKKPDVTTSSPFLRSTRTQTTHPIQNSRRYRAETRQVSTTRKPEHRYFTTIAHRYRPLTTKKRRNRPFIIVPSRDQLREKKTFPRKTTRPLHTTTRLPPGHERNSVRVKISTLKPSISYRVEPSSKEDVRQVPSAATPSNNQAKKKFNMFTRTTPTVKSGWSTSGHKQASATKVLYVQR